MRQLRDVHPVKIEKASIAQVQNDHLGHRDWAWGWKRMRTARLRRLSIFLVAVVASLAPSAFARPREPLPYLRAVQRARIPVSMAFVNNLPRIHGLTISDTDLARIATSAPGFALDVATSRRRPSVEPAYVQVLEVGDDQHLERALGGLEQLALRHPDSLPLTTLPSLLEHRRLDVRRFVAGHMVRNGIDHHLVKPALTEALQSVSNPKTFIDVGRALFQIDQNRENKLVGTAFRRVWNQQMTNTTRRQMINLLRDYGDYATLTQIGQVPH